MMLVVYPERVVGAESVEVFVEDDSFVRYPHAHIPSLAVGEKTDGESGKQDENAEKEIVEIESEYCRAD